MLVLFVAAVLIVVLLFACLFSSLRLVQARQALIRYNALTGEVQDLVVGPELTVIWPGAQATLPIDLTIQRLPLQMDDVVARDRMPVVASLDLMYQFDPRLLATLDMTAIFPYVPQARSIVELLANYCLRTLVAQFTMTDLLSRPIIRARIERRFRCLLDDALRWLGIRVLFARLLLWPTERVLEAEIAVQVRMRTLRALVDVLGEDHELLAQFLPLEALRLLEGDTRLLANLHLQPGQGSDSVIPTLHWIVDR